MGNRSRNHQIRCIPPAGRAGAEGEGKIMPRPRNQWTDEETNTLVSMWPNASIMEIATALHRTYSATRVKAKLLREEALLKGKNPPRNSSINPDQQDFDDVKEDYRRKHDITAAQLSARLESDDQLAAELYRLAQAARAYRVVPRTKDHSPKIDPQTVGKCRVSGAHPLVQLGLKAKK
jgi:hypothetical protein